MTIDQIKVELAQLDALIAHEPQHYGEALQRGQAVRRRALLEAELKKVERLDLSEAERARLRRHFSAFDDQTFERLLAMNEAELQQLLPQGKG